MAKAIVVWNGDPLDEFLSPAKIAFKQVVDQLDIAAWSADDIIFEVYVQRSTKGSVFSEEASADYEKPVRGVSSFKVSAVETPMAGSIMTLVARDVFLSTVRRQPFRFRSSLMKSRPVRYAWCLVLLALVALIEIFEPGAQHLEHPDLSGSGNIVFVKKRHTLQIWTEIVALLGFVRVLMHEMRTDILPLTMRSFESILIIGSSIAKHGLRAYERLTYFAVLDIMSIVSVTSEIVGAIVLGILTNVLIVSLDAFEGSRRFKVACLSVALFVSIFDYISIRYTHTWSDREFCWWGHCTTAHEVVLSCSINLMLCIIRIMWLLMQGTTHALLRTQYMDPFVETSTILPEWCWPLTRLSTQRRSTSQNRQASPTESCESTRPTDGRDSIVRVESDLFVITQTSQCQC